MKNLVCKQQNRETSFMKTNTILLHKLYFPYILSQCLLWSIFWDVFENKTKHRPGEVKLWPKKIEKKNKICFFFSEISVFCLNAFMLYCPPCLYFRTQMFSVSYFKKELPTQVQLQNWLGSFLLKIRNHIREIICSVKCHSLTKSCKQYPYPFTCPMDVWMREVFIHYSDTDRTQQI